ncbi:hypothetical protein RIF29_33024 [Crotalaria pallida]|uniref:Uncharacterized protein n=1 Tax=Crotalaria pallida TaxID=3830 RepID=A0AAN9E7W1_CROPI
MSGHDAWGCTLEGPSERVLSKVASKNFDCWDAYSHKFFKVKIFLCPQLFYVTAEIPRQEARLKMERDNLEKEKSVLIGTASNQDNQDGALEITVGVLPLVGLYSEHSVVGEH